MSNQQFIANVPPIRIVVTGFMGAGKTTVARALARKLNGVFVDLDEFIDVQLGRTPQQIIDEEDEATFREIETGALREVLISVIDEKSNYVISLGGGTWMLERNRALITSHHCLTIWLDAPFELCWARITREDTDLKLRPFARNYEKAYDLYIARRASYATAARRVAVDETKSIGETAAEIINFAATL